MKKNIAAHILIVDDESYIRRTLKSVLENEPYEVDEAIDGVDCLTKIKQKKYDVIFPRHQNASYGWHGSLRKSTRTQP